MSDVIMLQPWVGPAQEQGMRMKLRDVARGLGLVVGCSDNSCIWGSPGGMATNGGCRCMKELDHRHLLLQMRAVANHLMDVYNVVGRR